MTKNDVWELISGEPVIDRATEAPWGNYPDGRVCEEYHVRGQWVHVALNPALGGDIDDWAISQDQPTGWLV